MQERMANTMTRRETLKRGLAAAGALALVPEWAWPVLAQGEVDVPFTDIPATFNPTPANGNTRMLDIRKLDGLLTPTDQFFYIQHYNRPEIDPAAYRLTLTGLVKKPLRLTLAELQAMRAVDIVNGYECSGNSGRSFQGLSSNGRFTGVRLRDVLRDAGVAEAAREVVFFGGDKGPEDVVFRTNTLKVQQQFARSITLENAMKPEPVLAWALNGQPLDREHGVSAPADHAGLVRCRQRQVALGDPPAGGPLPRQLPGAVVPHRPCGRRQRRADRPGDAVRRNRSDEAAI